MDSSTAEPALFQGAAELPLVAVHDESGRYRVDRYFVTGFVFIKAGDAAALAEGLRDARERGDYWRELHYLKMTEVDGRSGAKFRVASRWLDQFERALAAGSVSVSVLAVDCRCPTYDHARFRRRPHYAYNRFTRMALEGGIRWLYPDTQALSIRVLSDGKSRNRRGGDEDYPDAGDNFCSYLPRMARNRIARETDWPGVAFVPPVVEEVAPTQDGHDDCSLECEFVQLADLVVSSVGAALRGASKKPAKRELAHRAAGWVRDAEGRRGRRLELFRRFSFSVFAPGGEPAFARQAPLAIEPGVHPNQIGLF